MGRAAKGWAAMGQAGTGWAGAKLIFFKDYFPDISLLII